MSATSGGPVGEHRLNDFARSELEAARRDPRIDRERGAIVADFWNAFEEAERARTFGIAGLHELQHALERTEAELGVSRDDESLDRRAVAELQVAWERAEMARAEIEAGHPHHNVQALLAINSALDSLVEELAPALRAMRIDWLIDNAFERADAELPEAVAQVSPEMRRAIVEAARSVVDGQVPEPKQLRGEGADRYEAVLAHEGLGAAADRPIPENLADTLTELSAIRDVLVHRAGRIDERALKAAPSLRGRYRDGELIRVTREDYRIYSAAVRCYAMEVLYRPLRSSPAADDATHGPDLANWRGYCRVGT
jgi:hypothetical protein